MNINKQPDNYENLQWKWSKANGKNIRKGAKKKAKRAIRIAKRYKLPMSSVLVIGSQFGYEAESFRNHGVKDVWCLDISKEFIKVCIKKKFKCIYSSIEDWIPTRKFDGVFASHTLEHSYNAKKAVNKIKKIAEYWCYVEVPIEPKGTNDKAHLSVFKSNRDIKQLFLPWKKYKYEEKSDSFWAMYVNRNWYNKQK